MWQSISGIDNWRSQSHQPTQLNHSWQAQWDDPLTTDLRLAKHQSYDQSHPSISRDEHPTMVQSSHLTLPSMAVQQQRMRRSHSHHDLHSNDSHIELPQKQYRMPDAKETSHREPFFQNDWTKLPPGNQKTINIMNTWGSQQSRFDEHERRDLREKSQTQYNNIQPSPSPTKHTPYSGWNYEKNLSSRQNEWLSHAGAARPPLQLRISSNNDYPGQSQQIQINRKSSQSQATIPPTTQQNDLYGLCSPSSSLDTSSVTYYNPQELIVHGSQIQKTGFIEGQPMIWPKYSFCESNFSFPGDHQTPPFDDQTPSYSPFQSTNLSKRWNVESVPVVNCFSRLSAVESHINQDDSIDTDNESQHPTHDNSLEIDLKIKPDYFSHKNSNHLMQQSKIQYNLNYSIEPTASFYERDIEDRFSSNADVRYKTPGLPPPIKCNKKSCQGQKGKSQQLNSSKKMSNHTVWCQRHRPEGNFQSPDKENYPNRQSPMKSDVYHQQGSPQVLLIQHNDQNKHYRAQHENLCPNSTIHCKKQCQKRSASKRWNSVHLAHDGHRSRRERYFASSVEKFKEDRPSRDRPTLSHGHADNRSSEGKYDSRQDENAGWSMKSLQTKRLAKSNSFCSNTDQKSKYWSVIDDHNACRIQPMFEQPSVKELCSINQRYIIHQLRIQAQNALILDRPVPTRCNSHQGNYEKTRSRSRAETSHMNFLQCERLNLMQQNNFGASSMNNSLQQCRPLGLLRKMLEALEETDCSCGEKVNECSAIALEAEVAQNRLYEELCDQKQLVKQLQARLDLVCRNNSLISNVMQKHQQNEPNHYIKGECMKQKALKFKTSKCDHSKQPIESLVREHLIHPNSKKEMPATLDSQDDTLNIDESQDPSYHFYEKSLQDSSLVKDLYTADKRCNDKAPTKESLYLDLSKIEHLRQQMPIK